MEILRCEHISKIYRKGNTYVKALDDVPFRVEKGEIVSIIGPSGSGKSTLLHILGGVDKTTEGKVLSVILKGNVIMFKVFDKQNFIVKYNKLQF